MDDMLNSNFHVWFSFKAATVLHLKAVLFQGVFLQHLNSINLYVFRQYRLI